MDRPTSSLVSGPDDRSPTRPPGRLSRSWEPGAGRAAAAQRPRRSGARILAVEAVAKTREAYAADLASWLTFCAGLDLDPLTAGIHHADAYLRLLAASGDPRSRRPPAPARHPRRPPRRPRAAPGQHRPPHLGPARLLPLRHPPARRGR